MHVVIRRDPARALKRLEAERAACARQQERAKARLAGVEYGSEEFVGAQRDYARLRSRVDSLSSQIESVREW